MGCLGGPIGSAVRTTDGLATDNGRALNCYHGHQVDAGAAATVEVREGSVSGTILGKTILAAAGEGGDPSSVQGIACATGIWVEVVSGTPTVTIFGH